MRLKGATILVIIFAVATFILRVTGTVYPQFFINAIARKSFVIISQMSFLSIVAFFIILSLDFIKKEHVVLRIASILMIIGSLAVSVLFLKVVYSVFTETPYPNPGLVEVLVPFIGAAFTLFFFIVFYKSLLATFGFHLKLAVILSIVSSVITFILKSIILGNYVFSGEFNWFLARFKDFPIIIILLSVFWLLTSLYFYISFYKELNLNRLSGR